MLIIIQSNLCYVNIFELRLFNYELNMKYIINGLCYFILFIIIYYIIYYYILYYLLLYIILFIIIYYKMHFLYIMRI